MEALLKKAKEFLDQNLQFNVVELSDGINRVHVARFAGYTYIPYVPTPWYYTTNFPTTPVYGLVKEYNCPGW